MKKKNDVFLFADEFVGLSVGEIAYKQQKERKIEKIHRRYLTYEKQGLSFRETRNPIICPSCGSKDYVNME